MFRSECESEKAGPNQYFIILPKTFNHKRGWSRKVFLFSSGRINRKTFLVFECWKIGFRFNFFIKQRLKETRNYLSLTADRTHKIQNQPQQISVEWKFFLLAEASADEMEIFQTEQEAYFSIQIYSIP